MRWRGRMRYRWRWDRPGRWSCRRRLAGTTRLMLCRWIGRQVLVEQCGQILVALPVGYLPGAARRDGTSAGTGRWSVVGARSFGCSPARDGGGPGGPVGVGGGVEPFQPPDLDDGGGDRIGAHGVRRPGAEVGGDLWCQCLMSGREGVPLGAAAENADEPVQLARAGRVISGPGHTVPPGTALVALAARVRGG